MAADSADRSTAPTAATTDVGPFTIVPAWVVEELAGKPNALLAYVIIGLHADRGNRAFPSIGRMAKMMAASDDTVRRAIRVLQAKGMVSVVARQARTGRTTSNAYVLVTVDPGKSGGPSHGCEGGPLHGCEGRSTEQEPEEPSGAAGAAPTKRHTKHDRDALWDALLVACKIDGGSLTKTARGNLGKTVNELLDAGANQQQVMERAAVWRRRYPKIAPTHTALRSRWAELAPEGSSQATARTRPRIDPT
jgi:hypothetical protein